MKKLIVLSVIFTLSCFACAELTIVDADIAANTTYADGSAVTLGTVFGRTYDNLWEWRVEGVHQGSGFYVSSDGAEANGTCKPLKTTVTGLANGLYNLYVVFPVSTAEDWRAYASTADSDYVRYDKNTAGLVVLESNTDESYKSVAALVGQVNVTDGTLSLYVNDDNGGSWSTRTTYDAIAYEAAYSSTAFDPNPVHGQGVGTGDLMTGVALNADLSWTAPDDPNINPNYTIQYAVYADPNQTKVDTGLGCLYTRALDPATSFSPAVDFTFNTQYFWRVDTNLKFNGASTDQTLKGVVWTFKTISNIPAILTNPDNAKVFANGTENVQFTVTYQSDVPVTGVTWYQDGGSPQANSSAVWDQTSSTLTITGVTPANLGSYHFVVANSGGSDTSNAAVLIEKRKLAWYQFEQNFQDSVGLNDAALVGPSDGLQYLTPVFPGAPGAIAGQSYAADPNGSVYGLLTTEAYPKTGFGNGLDEGTITFWFKADEMDSGYIMGSYNDGTTSALHIGIQTDGAVGKMHINLRNESGGPGTTTATATINDNQWHHCALTMTSAGYMLYIDVEENGAQSAAMTYAAWDYPMTLMARNQRGSINGLFSGVIDDLQILNYALTQEEIAQVYYGVSGIQSCIGDYAAAFDVANEQTGLVYGDLDFTPDCKIGIADFAAWAARWLDNGFYPQP